MLDHMELVLDLTTALAIGLLVGTERGWRERDFEDIRQVAGIRTFTLAGLLGGLSALLAGHFGVWAWVVMALLVGLLAVAGYLADVGRSGDQGMTSEVALLATFLLGSLAVADSRLLAAGGGVVVALLLSLKESLHAALKHLDARELSAAFKLLFISVVMLPVLPNQGYGPWQVFNPYASWWMVVLIAGLGFAAYVAVRLTGTRHGLLITALLGGLVSSTAMTLTLAGMHGQRRLQPLLAAGLLATSALMFPRVALEVGLVNVELYHDIFLEVAIGTGIFGLVGYLVVLYVLTRPLLSMHVHRRLCYLPLAWIGMGPALPGMWDRTMWVPIGLAILATLKDDPGEDSAPEEARGELGARPARPVIGLQNP